MLDIAVAAQHIAQEQNEEHRPVVKTQMALRSRKRGCLDGLLVVNDDLMVFNAGSMVSNDGCACFPNFIHFEQLNHFESYPHAASGQLHKITDKCKLGVE